MTNLLKKINLEKLGIFSFLLFFLFTPLLPKIQIAAGVYVEPLAPFLGLGLVLILFSFWRSGKRGKLWEKAKNLLLPNRLSFLYFLLIAFLLGSFVYGYFLTGIFSGDDLLHLVKYTLYFLPFPLAIYVGRILGFKKIHPILVLIVIVGLITAVVSFARVYEFIRSQGPVDFWVYSFSSRSTGFLGQFLDLKNWVIESTSKAAHATYGLYASVVLAVCLGLASRVKTFAMSWFTYTTAATVIFFGAILYALSRGALMTALLVVASWFCWLLISKKWSIVVISFVLMILTSFVLIKENPAIIRKVSSTILPQGVSEDSEIALDASTVGRLERWGKIFEVFRKHPSFAIFGVGYNSENLQKFAGVGMTHSFFLDMLVRGGIGALVLALMIWFYLFKLVLGFVFSKDWRVQAFGFPLLGFVLGWFVDNLVSGEQFFSDAPMIAFWGTVGLIYAKQHFPKEGVKKVLIALTSSGPGGAPKVVYDLLSHLPEAVNSQLDFVIAAPAGGVFNKKFKDLGYRVYHVPLDQIGIRGFAQLLKVARKEEVDLINSHGKGAGLYVRPIGALLGIPVVQTFHGLHYEYGNLIVRFLYLRLEKFLTVFTKLVVCDSPSQQKEGLALKLFSKSKSRAVVNGIYTRTVDKIKVDRVLFRKKLGLGPDDFVVIMVARFDPVKGHERLVGILPDLLKKIPNLKIVFAGDGERCSATERLTKKLGVSSAVRFLGQRLDVFKIFKVSDAAILSSYHEGMPLTVLEAMACRLPVVGSDVVGIRDLVKDGETGYLVDFDNKEEVVKAFRKLDNKTIRRKLGEQGRRLVEEKFSMEKFVKSTLAVYQESLE